MSELKPCPFCGGTDLHLESFSGWGNDVIVCYDCLATFSQQEITCEEDLIKAWNKRVGDAPTIEPEPQWIPCRERLPEDSQFVLMTIRRMDEHYNHKPFISVGYITWNQSLWWCAHDGDCEPNDVRVDAWMPLPAPYKERREK